ncbi:hypothetical protein [Candidatus Vidania fulgoroideorum]
MAKKKKKIIKINSIMKSGLYYVIRTKKMLKPIKKFDKRFKFNCLHE